MDPLAFLTSLDWAGNITSFVIGGVLGGSWRRARRFFDRTPLRRLLGQLADPDEQVSIFLRDMVSGDGKYYSWQPDRKPIYWRGFSVLAQPDVETAGEVVNLLGRVGRSHGFVWRSVERDFDLCTEPVICVGGNPKADQILSMCEPHLVRYDFPDQFVTSDGTRFQMSPESDYGLLYKGAHPETGAECLLLLGCGVEGTRGAGSFLSREGKVLAALYGSKPFAVIVSVPTLGGRDSAYPVWYSKGVDWNTLLVHPFVAWKNRRLLRSPEAGDRG